MPLDPQAQAFVDSLAQQQPPGWEELTPHQAREVFCSLSDLFGTGPDLERVEDHILANGTRIRLYSDSCDERRPVVMFFHGGGWVLGNLETHDALCRRLAKESGCTIVSVDYGLSPENRFPFAVNQCYEAMVYVTQNGSKFSIDETKLAVAGDSAGGNLAAAVAIKARDQQGPAIQLQVLIYPVIEPKFDTASYEQFAVGHGLTRASMKYFWQQYLGDQSPGPLAAVSRAPSHANLPAAHVVTAQYDVLCAEGELYADLLARAGTAVTKRQYPGVIHGFVHFAGIFDAGMKATSDIAQVLRTQLTQSSLSKGHP